MQVKLGMSLHWYQYLQITQLLKSDKIKQTYTSNLTDLEILLRSGKTTKRAYHKNIQNTSRTSIKNPGFIPTIMYCEL